MRPSLFNISLKIIAVLFFIFSAAPVAAQNPVANFSATPPAGCSALVVNFQDLSTGSPTSWNWSFGNGNTSTLQNPSATYFASGMYTITLTVTNANGSSTLTRPQYVTVYEPPTADFSANNTNGCFPLRVQFTDLSTPGAGNSNVSWVWDFGDGNTSPLQNPLHTYTSSGAYTVTLRVTNDKGCIRTFTRPNYITVTNGVTAGFTNTQPVVCNAPADITFTNTSTGPPTLSYQWNFGDGSPFSTLPNPVHTYVTGGTFIVTLVTTSSAGCEDTAFSAPIVIGGYNTTFTAPIDACINEQVAFTNTSTPSPLSSNWTFGDGNSTGGLNATHSYSATGNYTVWLYNTYTNCNDSISQTININPRPVADFTAPVTSRCEPPLTVNFQDLSTGGATAWQWDFGDGNVSSLQNPSHTYTAYGSFTVTLVVTNGFGCTDTIVKPDTIQIRRAAITVLGLPVRGCIPFTIFPVPLINSVDAVTSYQWDFGDGGTSLLATPAHTYTIQGTYNVRLIITTSTGCTDTLLIPAAVRVGSKPVANFSAAPTPVCARQPVQFTDLSVPADEWLWDFGDGSTSTMQHPNHVYNDTGYFTIRLIAYNNGCPDTMVRTNYIYVLPPIARFFSTPDCLNRLRFIFTDVSIAPLTWDWNFGDGSPNSTVQNPVHIFPSLGTYNVTLIVTNGSCADTIINTINAVSENPDFMADRLADCHDATITFAAININATNIVNYLWDFGDGFSMNTSSPAAVHTYTASGNYTVSLTITDINGCTNAFTKNNYIRINGPVANFNATNVSGCENLSTTFNDLSVTDGINAITNWQWNFGDGVIQNFSGPPFQHIYNTVGTFSVQLVVTDILGCKDSITLTNLITITDPVPNFVSADTLTCAGAPVTFTNISTPAGFSSQWYFGDGGTSTLTSPVYTYAASGLYDVKLTVTDAFGCSDSITKTAYIRVENPVAGFTVNDSLSSCLPFEVNFTNTSQFYVSSAWDFGPGEGNSTVTDPVHYYSIPGTYPVKLVVTNPGGCKDSIIKNILVYDTVGARVNYLPISGCKPLDVNFNTFTPGQMASYFWDFGDGNTLSTTTPNVSHVYTSFGNFLPSVIMEDPTGCLIPLQGIDTVYISGADANFGIDSSIFCDFATVTFTDSTTFNDPIAFYSWSFGDGGVSAQQSPVHQYNSPGLYSVQLIVETQLGCRDTLTKPNLISVVQRPLIDINGDSVICVNSSLIHAGIFLQPDTSIVTWQWNFPNGNVSTLQNPPPQTYSVAGTFVVTSIATNSTGCKDTTLQTILVNPLPVVTMPGQMTVQTGFPVTIPATYSPNTVNWIWSPSTGLSCANCPTPEAGPHFNTIYQVYFTDDNGCSNLGEIEVIVICKNANLFVPNTFTPNGDGSNDIFYPRGKGLERVKHLRVFNRWGEVVFEKRDFPVNDASSGWNGMYKGNKPKADVYVYQIEVFCDNGDIIRLNGNIALIL